MKRFLKVFILVLVSIYLLPVQASSVKTYNRNDYSNLGVNKPVKNDSSNREDILNTPYVDASLKIYDFADLLTEKEETSLKEEIDSFIQETKMDLVIVTTSFSYSYDNENVEYADNFYNYNDFGMDFTNYSGVIILRNANSADPYYYIGTTGDAIRYYSDARISNILNYISSSVRNKEYKSAFSKNISELKYYYEQGIPSENSTMVVNSNGSISYKFYINPIISFLIPFIIVIIIIVNQVKKNKMVHVASNATAYETKVNYTNKRDIFLNRTVTRHYIGHVESSGGFGGGGSSFHSGSSGSSHGGGGAHM